MMRGIVIAAALACTLAAGCTGDETSLAIADECNPLGGAGCITPWPSAVYQTPAPGTATGILLDIPAGALPTNADGIPIDPLRFNLRDGFSPATFLFTAFPGGVDPSNLVPHGDFAASLTDDSPTVIVDMSTGLRVPHFAEVDVNAGDDFDNQALYLRPAVRLSGSTRYAVAIRRSLKSRDGGPLPIPEGFLAILNGTELAHPLLGRVRGRYTEIFAALDAAGVPKNDLVVAWDFVTASDESTIETMIGARDAVLTATGERGVNLGYSVDTDEPYGDGTQIMRRIIGTFEAPLLLTDGGSARSRLARDEDGRPMVVGSSDAPFVAIVPVCAATAGPVPMVIFGHGFFGDISEAYGRYMRYFSEQLCVVVLATEWRGMADRDVAGAALALNDANRLLDFGERIVQGITNHMALAQLARGTLASELLVLDGESIVDTSRIYFYGVSQGHVLGLTFMAYDPSIERGVLAFGGGNWGLLFERSTNWPAYRTIIAGSYPGPLNTVVIESLMLMAFDPTENIHIASRVLDNPLPGVGRKQLLIQMAVGDAQMSNLATEQQSRMLGVPVLAPAMTVPYGLTAKQGPLDSALAIYDEKPTPLPPTSNELNEIDNDTHELMRYQPAVIRQIEQFWSRGEIVHTCDGVCNCSLGNCE